MWIPSWIILPAVFAAWPLVLLWVDLPRWFLEQLDQFATGKTPAEIAMARARLELEFRCDFNFRWPEEKYQKDWHWPEAKSYAERYEEVCGLD